ncbi:MAG: rhomboid family intramembrane serine protease [candidate division Zixibacteria bacterium]|nr:rhomboid family intramembrane serine protease [candidate division Zixibacteria bacterium]
MPVCPKCTRSLNREKVDGGYAFACGKCRGRAIGLDVLKKQNMPEEFLLNIRREANESDKSNGRQCPQCNTSMSSDKISLKNKSLKIDYCRECRLIWIDHREYKKLSWFKPEPPESANKSAKNDPRPEITGLRKHHSELHGDSYTDPPDTWWEYILGIIGFPIESGDYELSKLPLLVWISAAVIALVFLVSLIDLKSVAYTFGFIPSQWYRYSGLTIITSLMLHADLWHLIGNLYFYIVFGDNVEDLIGRAKFIVLLLGSHIGGTILHGIFTNRPDIPVIGASAGIFGLMAFYTVLFPKKKFKIVLSLYFYFHWINISVKYFFLLYAILQIEYLIEQLKGTGYVSALGHIGGLIVGLGAGLYVKHRNKQKDSTLANQNLPDVR